MYKTCASPNQIKSQCRKRSWAHNPTLSRGAVVTCELPGKGESVFSKRGATDW